MVCKNLVYQNAFKMKRQREGGEKKYWEGGFREGKKLGYTRRQFTQNYPNAEMMKGQSEKEREEKETLRERE